MWYNRGQDYRVLTAANPPIGLEFYAGFYQGDAAGVLATAPDSTRALEGWYDRVENADWESPQQLKADYPSASILGDNRVVFNIRGNNYRLVARIDYQLKRVYVLFIGTHAEYDRIDAREV